MKLSPKDEAKDKLISEISKFFEKDLVEKIARETGFVQRSRKLDCLNFFSLCFCTTESRDEFRRQLS
jgi:hypothetical protein